jgi:two-component system, cell cycle response regulator
MQVEIENRRLRAQLRHLIQQARENERTLDRVTAVELRLAAAPDLAAILSILTQDLRRDWALDHVGIALLDTDGEIHRALAESGIMADGSSIMLLSGDQAARLLLNAPFVGAYRRRLHGPRFNGRDDLAGVAILPLGRGGRALGQLHFGSCDAHRYRSGVDSYFLMHLAAITGICVENALNVWRLRELGVTDTLTGIRNRRYFEQRYADELSRLRRDGGALTCLFADIDRFKAINDTYGHPAGDRVICQVAGGMARHLRPFDLLARYGGEEFVMLLPGLGSREALPVAERIREAVQDLSIEIDAGGALSVTVSIGLATLRGLSQHQDPSEAGEQLLHAADQALLVAKSSGRNRVVVGEI